MRSQPCTALHMPASLHIHQRQPYQSDNLLSLGQSRASAAPISGESSTASSLSDNEHVRCRSGTSMCTAPPGILVSFSHIRTSKLCCEPSGLFLSAVAHLDSSAIVLWSTPNLLEVHLFDDDITKLYSWKVHPNDPWPLLLESLVAVASIRRRPVKAWQRIATHISH